MKRLALFFLVALLLCSGTSAFAELSVDDLDKIQKLLDKLEERIDKRFTDLEKRITSEIQAVDKRLSENIQTLEKNFGERLSFHGSLIIALIIAIIGFVSVPMGFITFQYFKIRAQQEEEIKVLREKIEALEAQMLVETRSKMFKKEQEEQIQNE